MQESNFNDIDIDLLQSLLQQSNPNSKNTQIAVFLEEMDIHPGSFVVSIQNLKKLYETCNKKRTTIKKIYNSCKDTFSISLELGTIYLNVSEEWIQKHSKKKSIEIAYNVSNKILVFLENNTEHTFEQYSKWVKKNRLNTPLTEDVFKKIIRGCKK